MAVKTILQLGDPRLYQTAEEITQQELLSIRPIIADMHDTLMDFRINHGFGRALAAPQIGLNKRLVYAFIDQPMIFINPVLSQFSQDKLTMWDNCMSFPFLSIKVQRHTTCVITYFDLRWNEKTEPLEGALSELLQHECDHLDGILAVQRAIDLKSFAIRGLEQPTQPQETSTT